MDTITLTIIAHSVYALAIGTKEAMKAVNTLLNIVELYMKRKLQREAQTPTDARSKKNRREQAKRRSQRRE